LSEFREGGDVYLLGCFIEEIELPVGNIKAESYVDNYTARYLPDVRTASVGEAHYHR
jgi:hypothetical protein